MNKLTFFLDLILCHYKCLFLHILTAAFSHFIAFYVFNMYED